MPDLRTISKISATAEKTKTNKKQCSLFALPPELREVIFTMVAQDFLHNTKVPCRYTHGGYLNLSHEYDCEPLVYPEERQYTKSSELEPAFYNCEMQLYFECLHARLTIMTLVFSSSNDDDDRQCYSNFGNEIPIWILDSVRSVGYELDHHLKYCNRSVTEKAALLLQDSWAEPPNLERKCKHSDPWCNTQFSSFRKSIGSLARSLRILSREYTDYRPVRLLSVEVFGLCDRCSDRIQDCDKLFDELLGFKGDFVPPSKAPKDGILPSRPRVHRYQHPVHIGKVLEKFEALKL